MNDSEMRALAARIAKLQETRTQEMIDATLRDYLKTGPPAGHYSSFVWDGRRIVGAGAGGASAPFLCKYGINTAPAAIASGTTARINFDYQWSDPDPYVTTGASWAFAPTAAGWYEFVVNLKLQIAANPTGGSQVQLQYWENVSGVSTIAAEWQAIDFPASAVNREIKCTHHQLMSVGETASFRLSNGLGVNINLAGSTTGRKINTIVIKKVS